MRGSGLRVWALLTLASSAPQPSRAFVPSAPQTLRLKPSASQSSSPTVPKFFSIPAPQSLNSLDWNAKPTAPRSFGLGSLSSSMPEVHSPEACSLPEPEMECWRPTSDDVDRISWGKPAKKKCTGSRGVPHRLNEEERKLYDFARKKGFVEIGGSGWRKQRRAAPLTNTYRSWCDSRACAVIYLHKDKEGNDEVVLDLSPLRIPAKFPEIAKWVSEQFPGATVEALEGMGIIPDEEDAGMPALEEQPQGTTRSSMLQTAFIEEPIYRLPMFVVSWRAQRSEAKSLAKQLGEKFNTAEPSGKGKSTTLQRGMPNVKPGKNRRQGGYGIGGKNRRY